MYVGIWGVPKSMAQVSNIYDKLVSEKSKFQAKIITFCWFWLGKMHQNGLSGMYLGFEVCQIQWHRFQVSTISSSCKNQNFRQKFHILLILTGKNASKWLEGHIFRVWDLPNPVALVSNLCNKQFLWNQNLDKNLTFCWILTAKNASKWIEWYLFRVCKACRIQWHRFQDSTISSCWKIKISAKNFTFCWFWLRKMHQNGLSGAYSGFETCQIQWHLFQVSTIRSWKFPC